jgi:D-glycero-D-manno-heptose 1,7-bisphosphate phosphatase
LSRLCVFLDRDGVINEPAAPGDYIRTWSQFRFLPNAVDWIRIFNALGLLVIVVTNQRGVALGLIDPLSLEEIHANMLRALAAAGAHIDDVFVCPHDYGTCDCRKPQPGLILQAREKCDIDIERSLLIGDTDLDEQLARNCGLRFVLATGDGHVSPAFETPGSPLA